MSEETKTVVTTTSIPRATPAAPPLMEKATKSPALRSLAAKRAKIKEGLFLDLKVPRWSDPEIYVRYKPVDLTISQAAIEKRQNSKIPEWQIYANADLLAMGCEGVYAVLDDDPTTKYSLRIDDETGPWTKFDADLAANLGSLTTAAEVVRALYFTDQDLTLAAAQVSEWSGKISEQADTDF